MNRTLGMERLYTLGDFKNIKVTDTITDIPVEFLTDVEVIGALRFLQLLQSDKTYLYYLESSGALRRIETLLAESGETSGELIQKLLKDIDTAKEVTFAKLKEAFASETITEEKTEND